MKKNTIQIFVFCLLAALFFNGVWWLSIPLGIWYAFRYPAYELIFFGFCIDVHFAPSAMYFYYTLITTALVVLATMLRPRLRRHSHTYA